MIQITGKVSHGDHYGRALGFPTANLDRREYSRKNLKIRFGVWVGRAEIVSSDKYQVTNYAAAIVIGPIDKTGKPKIEAHILNFKGNLYGKKLSLTLIKYLRPFKKFANERELKLQIAKDIKKSKI